MTTRATTPITQATQGTPPGTVRRKADVPPEPAAPLESAGPGRTVPPVADCTADRAGGLTFDVRLPETAEAGCVGQDPETGRRRTEDAAMLLLRRGGDLAEAGADVVRLPLTPVAAGGPLRAALPSTMPLLEGRWDAYLDLGSSGTTDPQRLLPGIHDLRSLVGRTPRHGRTWLGVRIPYAARDGCLTVRAWLRWPHAEAGEVLVEQEGMVLRGRLYGAELEGGALLVAQARHPDRTQFSSPVTREEDDSGAEGTGFTGALRYAELTGYPVWDLLLRTGSEGDPVRIARILDDVPDKKRIFVYPPREVTGKSGPFTVLPYYTLDNDLSVRVAEGDLETV